MTSLLAIVGILLGCIVAFFMVLFALPLIPGAVASLANNPNANDPRRKEQERGSEERDYPPSTFGFFTKLAPGQVKIIERGERFVHCIMRYDGHLFKGQDPNNDIRRNTSDYWEVVETKKHPGTQDAHPIPTPKWRWTIAFFGIPVLWWLWKRWVYMVTGHVFTGIYPFQQVLVYPIERSRTVKRSDGVEEVFRVADYSDHFRVADFRFPVLTPSADTKDKIAVKVLNELIARCFNPYLTAYGTDDWSPRLYAAASDGVTNFTRPRPLEEVLSGTAVTIRALGDEIKKIGERPVSGTTASDTPNSTLPFGIEISQVLTVDISLANPSDAQKLGDLAIARVDRQAKEERAKGDAAQLREQAEIMNQYGHNGLAVLAAERNVRTADAAAKGKGAVVVVGGGSNTVDPIEAAMLHELKQLNNGETNGTE